MEEKGEGSREEREAWEGWRKREKEKEEHGATSRQASSPLLFGWLVLA